MIEPSSALGSKPSLMNPGNAEPKGFFPPARLTFLNQEGGCITDEKCRGEALGLLSSGRNLWRELWLQGAASSNSVCWHVACQCKRPPPVLHQTTAAERAFPFPRSL